MTKPKNKIISIGWTGCKNCYLNVSREEAIARYNESERTIGSDPYDEAYLTKHGIIEEFEFDDEFNAYEVWR